MPKERLCCYKWSFGLDLPLRFHAVAVGLQIRSFAPGQREQGGEEKRITPLAQDQIRIGPLDERVPSVARREILASLGLSLPPVSKFFHRRQ
jgi:hypothetical protein